MLDLLKDPIPKLIFRLALPVSIGFFFNTMFNVVDTYFAGHITTDSLAALGLSFPVFFLILGFGNGFSTGTTALIGNALGAEDGPLARSFSIQGIGFGVVFSLFLGALGYFVSPFLFRVLGATDRYLEEALLYMRTIFYGTPFFILNYMFNATLTAQGDTRSFRNFLIAGFALNCLFNPWFIYGWLGVPAMGIRGLALATILIQALGMVYLTVRVVKTDIWKNLTVREALPDPAKWREIIRQGIPSSLNYLTIAAGVFVITYFVGRFGPQAVAAYGTAVRIEQIALLPSLGLNVSTLTIVARNSGAGNYGRIEETLKQTMKYGALIMAVGAVLVFAFSGLLMGIFTGDEEVIRIGTVYLRIDAFVLYAYVILGIHVSTLQGIKRPGFAVVIGIYRQLAAPMLIFWLLSIVMGLGVMGVWIGILVVTWTAAVIALFYARSKLRKEFIQ